MRIVIFIYYYFFNLDTNALVTRGQLVTSEPVLLKEIRHFFKEWRISFEYFLLHEQDISKKYDKCAQLFHIEYRNKQPDYSVVNKWCFFGKDLRLQTIPSPFLIVYDKDSDSKVSLVDSDSLDWPVRQWTKVELMQTFEEDGYYVKLIVNDEVVSKEKAINADGVQDFRLYQGCKGTSERPVTKETVHKCEAINVYIDNVVVETSQDQNIRPDIPDEIEGIPELVGDGNCIDGWTPIFGKCVKVFEQASSWYEARNICKENGARLVRIDNVPVNHAVGELNSNLLWMDATDNEEEGVWRNSDGQVLNFTLWRDDASWNGEQPDNGVGVDGWDMFYSPEQNCAAMSFRHYLATGEKGLRKWNDEDCKRFRKKRGDFYPACSYNRFGQLKFSPVIF